MKYEVVVQAWTPKPITKVVNAPNTTEAFAMVTNAHLEKHPLDKVTLCWLLESPEPHGTWGTGGDTRKNAKEAMEKATLAFSTLAYAYNQGNTEGMGQAYLDLTLTMNTYLWPVFEVELGWGAA